MAETTEVIQEAAFRLFAQRGYADTSVDEIVAAAGVSRSTFFRAFRSKESVIFPDHDRLLAQVEARLASSTQSSALAAVSDAVRLVFFHYVAEGDRARERYRLTSTVPALRERELVGVSRYQRLFRQYVTSWFPSSEAGQLRAELFSAGIVAAHNRVLRRWLRGEEMDPHVEIDTALTTVRETFEHRHQDMEPVVVVLPASMKTRDLEARIREWASEGAVEKQADSTAT
ncbi:TetR family transcriptional regulator [Nocardioides gansuensis]|uniref:TetR family transcriptional regulator n=1 Tax=Nocardioides gansuensis TaxID=2138300 RepID=A0A2T8F4J4_9ACTN|nr:TetR/AcrR family transcriptional regulator [Nocardioides gansuensis]PVG80632.1 TetR family transcriptional regulator [Nocardioides gansuensis]